MASEPPLVFLRDLSDVEPPRDRYAHYDEEDIYRLVPRPQWTGLEDEIWTPRSQEHDPQLEKVKALMKRNSSGSNGEASPAINALASTKFASKLTRKKRKNPRVKVRMLLNHRLVEGFVNFLIIWALFMEDIRIISLPKQLDIPIWYIHIFVMLVFSLEIVLRSYSQRGYFGSFYFSLDFLATITIVIDFLPLFNTPGGEGVGGATDAFRAAKSARVGTRLTRLIRVLRIIRVLKLLVTARGLKKNGKKDDEEADEGAPSELSKALQGQIAKKTIVFVLALLGLQVVIEFIPYANVSPWTLPDDRYRMGMAQLWTAINNDTANGIMGVPFKPMREQFASAIMSQLALNGVPTEVRVSLFRLDVYRYGPENLNLTFYPVPYAANGFANQPQTIGLLAGQSGAGPDQGYYLPPSEYPSLPVEYEGQQMVDWVPAWPAPETVHWQECSYDCLFPPSATRDKTCPEGERACPNARGHQRPLRDLRVYGPAELIRLPFLDDIPGSATYGLPVLEIWYETKMAEDVQSAMSLLLIVCIAALLGGMGYLLAKDVDQMVIQPIESMVDSVTKLAANPAYKLEQVTKVRYETDALKLSLAKIATMLQVGFGEAGNNLVAENLKKGDTVDPMVPGRKLLGAYGFCIIDEYEEVLECLSEEILPFTNTAASIVHEAVSENGGQPNRNLGEAFLCVWKPDVGDEDPQMVAPSVQAAAETKMCDGALTAFRRCVRGIAMSAPLQAYNQHEEIVKFFDGNYSTRIGYGLHYGWAIEGAVGTNIKIDCSYLSPNVNLAARLESATKMYGVNVLMSESFFGKLSTAVQSGCRRVDVVCLKGSSIPMAIYTCDRSNALYVAQRAIDRYGTERVVEEFQQTFEEGMDAFVAGDWGHSKSLFELALWICPRDKPAARILMHMDTHENHPDYGLATTPFVAPEGWPGYHILLSK